MSNLYRRQVLAGLLATAALPLGASRAWATKDDFPSRPIKWIVPFLPGTSPDYSARLFTEDVGQALGQPIVIENRAGAAGMLGTRTAAKAAADGYTWLYFASPTASNTLLFKKSGYDAINDFQPVVRFGETASAVVVNADSDIHSMDELVARLKAEPGKLYYASGGTGSPSHLGLERILDATGTEAKHVPYKGATEILNAVLGNQVAFGLPIYSVAYPLQRGGKIRMLAVTSAERNPATPDVPTLKELGVDVELVSWGGLAVPAGTPGTVVDTIYQTFVEALKNPELVQKYEQRGGLIRVMGPQEMARSIEQEMEFTKAMMARIGMEPI